MEARRSFPYKTGLALVAVAAVYVGRDVWLSAMGRALIHDDGPGKAEIAVVLAGDEWGNRLIKGVELLQQGYVPRVLVSGPPGIYDVNEADAAIAFATRRGYPAEWFIPLRHTALSTREEARAVLEWLKEHNIHSVLLVTSDYHTARARRIFLEAERQRGGGPDLRTVAAPDKFFSAKGWWQVREGRKTAFLEWSKTLATTLGM